jgi:hypothetical protein
MIKELPSGISFISIMHQDRELAHKSVNIPRLFPKKENAKVMAEHRTISNCYLKKGRR